MRCRVSPASLPTFEECLLGLVSLFTRLKLIGDEWHSTEVDNALVDDAFLCFTMIKLKCLIFCIQRDRQLFMQRLTDVDDE